MVDRYIDLDPYEFFLNLVSFRPKVYLRRQDSDLALYLLHTSIVMCMVVLLYLHVDSLLFTLLHIVSNTSKPLLFLLFLTINVRRIFC